MTGESRPDPGIKPKEFVDSQQRFQLGWIAYIALMAVPIVLMLFNLMAPAFVAAVAIFEIYLFNAAWVVLDYRRPQIAVLVRPVTERFIEFANRRKVLIKPEHAGKITDVLSKVLIWVALVILFLIIFVIDVLLFIPANAKLY